MKLRFLGRTYSHSPVYLETISSDCTACYRGQKYRLSVPATSSDTSGDRSELRIGIRKYRGVSYIVEHQNSVPPKQKKICYQ